MTFRVYFYADQAYLSFVHNLIEKHCNETTFNVGLMPECVVAITSLNSALEAFLNSLAREIISDLQSFERKSIKEKIREVFSIGHWGSYPLQEISKLVSVRNYLVHFKDSNLGLTNSDGDWVVDAYNSKPVIDDVKEFNIPRITQYYEAVRKTMRLIVNHNNAQEMPEYQYIDTMSYEPYLIG